MQAILIFAAFFILVDILGYLLVLLLVLLLLLLLLLLVVVVMVVCVCVCDICGEPTVRGPWIAVCLASQSEPIITFGSFYIHMYSKGFPLVR